MNVLFCHPGSELYGSDRMAIQTITALVESGHAVTVVVPSDGPLVPMLQSVTGDVLIKRIAVTRKSYFSPTGLVKLALLQFASLIQALLILKKTKADLVFVNTIIQPIWLPAAKIMGRRTICHIRESENGSNKIIRKALVAPMIFADQIVCNSESTLAFVSESLPCLSRRTQTIYNGKNWDPYYKSDYKHPTVGPTQVVLVGRISPRKGQDIAIRAAGWLASKGIVIQLIFAGDVFDGYDWFRHELDNLAVESGLTLKPLYLGFVDDVADVLDRSHIAIVPSRQEPFGTVAAESMAAMRPTIVSDMEGLAEIVDDGVNGATFPPEDWQALGMCIEKIATNQQHAEYIAKNGYEHVRSAFSQENYNSKIQSAVSTQSALRTKTQRK
ncbi:hypothetical protein CH272_11540 [Rhodococcus sp. 05-340-1]|nr:hypothetical protein CH271_25095 [Rhodococcus sp. 05-340-2]OZD78337.1 hypothetical protein CH272_11540 [Rhodococcus sp. 05-340-1]